MSLLRPVSAILFDHDGTLVDSEPIHCQLWNRVLKPFAVTLSFEEFVSVSVGVPTKATAVQLVKDYQLPVSADTLMASKVEQVERYLHTQAFPLFDGAKEMVMWAHQQGYKTAIVSGARRDEVLATVKAYGLSDYLQVIVTADDVAQNKPSPESYQQAMLALGVTPEQCIAIEDSPSGIAAAKAATIKTLAVRHPYVEAPSLESAYQQLPSTQACLEALKEMHLINDRWDRNDD